MVATRTKTKTKKKKTAKKTAANPRTQKFELFLKSITEKFPDDPTAPGLAIAWIPNLRMFYVAIRRFKGYGGRDPEVYLSAKDESLVKAMNAVVKGYALAVDRMSATEEFLRSV